MRCLPSLRRSFIALNALFFFGLAHAAPNDAPPPEGPAHHAPCHGEPMGMPLPPMLHGIDLTEAQQDKLFMIFHEQAPALRAAHKKARQAEEGLRKLSVAPRFDEARAKALADQIGKAQAEALLLQTSAMAQAFALLSPEQRQQIEEEKRRLPEPEGRRQPAPQP